MKTKNLPYGTRVILKWDGPLCGKELIITYSNAKSNYYSGKEYFIKGIEYVLKREDFEIIKPQVQTIKFNK